MAAVARVPRSAPRARAGGRTALRPAVAPRVAPPELRSLLVVSPETAWEGVAAHAPGAGLLPRFVARPAPGCDARDPFGVGEILASLPVAPDGVLLVAPRSRAPGRLLPAPVLRGVPVGIVQADEPAELEPWLRALAPPAAAPVWAAMAMGKDFYLGLGRRFAGWMRAGGAPRGVSVGEWLADSVSRDRLCAELGRGPRLAVYLGHGRDRGWCGYQALRWGHVAAAEAVRPCGTVVAFACSTLKRARGRVPFGCRWVQEGRAAAYLGSVAEVEVEPGFRFAETFGEILAEGGRATVGEVLAEADRRLSASAELAGAHRELRTFRLVGNPLQPLF